MREIKFRGKDYGNNWQYGDLVCEKWAKDSILMIKKDKREWSIVEDTVGQFTGLKDKNGVEIYEGDIVSEKGHYVSSDKLVYQKIQWKENYSCWLRGEYQRLTPKNIKTYEIEVIGNIYDNPELLEWITKQELQVCKFKGYKILEKEGK